MKIGDLVKMKRGYSAPGLVLKIIDRVSGASGEPADDSQRKWATVLWSDYGKGIEKIRDLEVINASR